MKLYDLKKVLFITLLAFTTSVQLQAMSLQKLLLIMIFCSPGTETIKEVVKQQYIFKIKGLFGDDRITKVVPLPDGTIVLACPSMQLCRDIHNKNRFGTKYPASDKFNTSFSVDNDNYPVSP